MPLHCPWAVGSEFGAFAPTECRVCIAPSCRLCAFLCKELSALLFGFHGISRGAWPSWVLLRVDLVLALKELGVLQ